MREDWDAWKMRQRLPAPRPIPKHDADELPQVWMTVKVAGKESGGFLD